MVVKITYGAASDLPIELPDELALSRKLSRFADISEWENVKQKIDQLSSIMSLFRFPSTGSSNNDPNVIVNNKAVLLCLPIQNHDIVNKENWWLFGLKMGVSHIKNFEVMGVS